MVPRLSLAIGASLLCLVTSAFGQTEPIPRLEAGGPLGPVQALAFSPDGRTLYEAGFDKVVRVWTRDAKTGQFLLSPTTYRVPLGPGFDGAINALAVSPDGDWLAVGGLGAVRGRARFDQVGVVASSRTMTPEMQEDEGTIHLFHTRRAETRRLRGHRGAVLALAFGPAQAGKAPALFSAAVEMDDQRAESGVLRAWDVDARTSTGRASFLSEFRVRHELAVSPLGIAVAWGDANLRWWSGQGDIAQQASERVFAAVFHPGVERLLTAVHDGIGGKLVAWRTALGEAPRVDGSGVALPPGHFPLAFRLLGISRAGHWGQAAVVVRVPSEDDAYLLYVVNLEPGRANPIQTTIPLWKYGNRLPALSVSPATRQVAVAGAPDGGVRIVSLTEKGAPQILRGAGAMVRHAAFALKGPDRALVLSETARRKPGERAAGPAVGDVLFDVTRRALTANLEGWKLDALPLGDWSVRTEVSKPNERRLVTWTAEVTRGGTVRLENIRAVTDTALRPPDALVKVPLLVVAYLDSVGQPVLALFNAASGERIRELAGHLGAVRGLAFSGDGRMLVSTAEDAMVCVWSLTNLPAHLGRRGMLRGVSLREDKGQLHVVALTDDSPSRERLRTGDVIDGVVDGGKVRPLKAQVEYLDALLAKRPGETITLRLAAGRGDVTLPVGQAIDEWKPLFSLFVTRPNERGERDWIAWNPNGPYDARDRETERFLGWHFNPTKPDAAVTFAGAEQYRERRRRAGILRHLLSEGALGAALASWEKEERGKPVPEASLRPWLDNDIGIDPRKANGRGQFIVSRPPTKLNLILDDLPPDRLARATWHIPGLTDQPRAFGDLSTRTLTATLAGLSWKRGDYTIRVQVRTNDDEPREAARDLLVYFQSPPPSLSATLPDNRTVTDADPAPERRLTAEKPDFMPRIAVTPRADGETVTVRVRHLHQGKERFHSEWKTGKKLVLDPPLRLEPGENVVEVRAVNASTPPAEAEAETTLLTLAIHHTPPVPDAAPVIRLETVVPLPELGDVKWDLEPGKPLIVDVPTVQFRARITSTKPLAEAEWFLDDPARSVVLRQLDKEKQPIEVRGDVRLSPGPHKLIVRAKTATSPRAEAVVELIYRPRLPEVVLEPPEKLERHAGYEPFEIVLRGRFVPAADAQPFTAQLVMNGKEERAIKPDAEWSVKLALTPGTHAVQVRLRNRWGAESTSEALHVRCLRPPRVVKADGSRAVRTPFSGPLTARFRSESPLDPETVHVSVGSAKVHTPVKVTKHDENEYSVRFEDVPLQEGENAVRLWVRNAEARSREPAEWTIRFVPPPKVIPPPEVVILEPAQDTNWTARALTVRVRIQSTAPLRSVTLSREGHRPLRQVFTATNLPRTEQSSVLTLRVRLDPAARTEAAATIDVSDGREVTLPWELLQEVNRFRVEAVNEGGAGTAEVAVNYVWKPVRLSLTRLVPRGGGQPIDLAEGPREDVKAPGGRWTLHGRVSWDDEALDIFAPSSRVVVRVNGLKLLPTPLSAARAKDRQMVFEAPVILPRAEHNLIEVELADVKVDGSPRRMLRVDCANPDKQPQRLHLLIVRHGDQSREQIAKRVLDSLQVDPKGCELVLHGPFTGTVRRGQVLTELLLIREQIELRARRDFVNNLLVIYYEGAEAVTSLGHFFPSSVKPTELELNRYALSCTSVADYLVEMGGAQVMLLDVARVAGQPDTAEDKIAHWPHALRPGIFRYSMGAARAPRPLLMNDLAKAKPAAADLERLAGDVARNFRTVVPNRNGSTSPRGLEGRAHGYTAPDLDELSYLWQLPRGYATIRLGREP